MPIKNLSLLFLALLASCGFQLRGSMPMTGLEQLYVANQVNIQQGIDQPVSARLVSDLESHVGQVLTSPASGVPGLAITDEQVIERSLSLSANLLNREVEIEKRIDYQIFDTAGEVIFANRLTASRQLTESQSSPGASDRERQILMNAINADLSRQLIYQLDAALNSSEAEANE